jgi:lipoprotein-anchoring transpeptidase ErfK/SrfK
MADLLADMQLVDPSSAAASGPRPYQKFLCLERRREQVEALRDWACMKTVALLAISIFFTISGTARSQDIQADAINNADLSAIPAERPPKAPPEPDPAIARLQILLDRAGSSPGVVDGHYGENVSKAIAGFEAMQRLPVDGKPDADLLARLPAAEPVVQPYVISDEDIKDLVEEIPADYAKQAKMKALGFTSVAERLSERFHMDVEFLKALNPASAFKAGDTISVAIPGPPRSGAVKRIEARKDIGQVLAYAEDGAVLAAYPATIGSEDSPSPSGRHKVKGVARMPPYTYNPKVNFQQGNNKKILKLPSGPNNPVGTVWIDLSEPTYGIHGTPEPSLIDKAGSHGCVRLTNWDAEELAGMVKPGVMVEFVN